MTKQARILFRVMGAILGLCLLVAAVTVPLRQPLRLLTLAAAMAVAPISSWILAMRYQHAMPGALQLLIPATLSWSVPLILWERTSRAAWLGVMCLFWVATGFVFTLGIWI